MSEREPQLQLRQAQPYLAIAPHVPTQAELRRAADRGFPELFGWLAEHGVEPAGPLFIRYVEVDDAGDPLDIELAVPVAAGVQGDGRVKAGALPAGAGPRSCTSVPTTTPPSPTSRPAARRCARGPTHRAHARGLRRALRHGSPRGAGLHEVGDRAGLPDYGVTAPWM